MKLGTKITRILSIDEESYEVRLRYLDGATGVVSLAHLFERPKGLAAEILRGGMFGSCFVEHGALAWPNGFELCPDALRVRLRVTRPTGRKRSPKSHIAKAKSRSSR